MDTLDKELRILMIEDLEEDAGLIERALRKEKLRFSNIRVDTREEFSNTLRSFQPDIILSDHSLPQFNSIEALRICREQGNNTPFILVTGAVSEEFAVMCLKQGADDYILKSNLSRLPIAIQTALENRKQEQNRKEQQIILQKQNEELLKINSELDSFVYSVSHNLRSPLSSILGLINVARMEYRNNIERPELYFELMERSVLKLDDTIKEILDYSQNSRSELAIKEVNLKDLIQDTFDELKYIKGFDEINKEITFEQDAEFYSDRHRLRVILTNLFSNAIKFRDPLKENPSICVKVNISTQKATLEVKDNGIGIHELLLPNVYKMFYRATEKSDGSGLGLYIVKETIERLNAEINIESTFGHGTTVSISIPNAKL